VIAVVTAGSGSGCRCRTGRTVVDASRVALKTVSSCCWKSRSDSSASSSEMSPRPISSSVYSFRTERLLSMMWYISGLVIEGSSPSLCPRRR